MSTYKSVDVEIELEDIIEYMHNCSSRELDKLKDEMISLAMIEPEIIGFCPSTLSEDHVEECLAVMRKWPIETLESIIKSKVL